MNTDGLTPVINLYKYIINKFYEIRNKYGRPYKYSQISFLLFFMAVLIKRINKFKAMAEYARDNYQIFGFPTAPSRQTIRRRFLLIPEFLREFIPFSAENLEDLGEEFSLKNGFIDKSLFSSKGGIRHKRQIENDYLPNKHIDTDASWCYSPRHKWVYGYGLHVISNMFHFPVSAIVTTAKAREETQVAALLVGHLKKMILLVGDKGYRVISVIKEIFEKCSIFLITEKPYKHQIDQFRKDYSFIISLEHARLLYRMRFRAIEPLFGLIKELFSLSRDAKLPFSTLPKVQAFLMLAVFTVQFMMVFNSVNHHHFNSITHFRGVFY